MNWLTMDLEIDRSHLVSAINFMELAGEDSENFKSILAESDQLRAGNIPHKILLTEDGYLKTKIIKEKVVLQ